jgi:hypothetical protein
VNLWLVQWLCPQRHALAAVPYNHDEHTPADAEALLRDAGTCVGLRPVCGLCGSTTLHFEHDKLPFNDWDTALAALFAVERRNIESRIAIDAAKGSSN